MKNNVQTNISSGESFLFMANSKSTKLNIYAVKETVLNYIANHAYSFVYFPMKSKISSVPHKK
jgi:hypothetical protein